MRIMTLVADEGGYWDKPEPPYDSQYDLAEFVQLNSVIEAVAGIDHCAATFSPFQENALAPRRARFIGRSWKAS